MLSEADGADSEFPLSEVGYFPEQAPPAPVIFAQM